MRKITGLVAVFLATTLWSGAGNAEPKYDDGERLIRKYEVTVRYDRSFPELLKHARTARIDKRITAGNFASGQGKSKTVDLHLFSSWHFNAFSGPLAVGDDTYLRERGFRHATMTEFLSFVEQNYFDKHAVCAMGSPLKQKDGIYYPCYRIEPGNDPKHNVPVIPGIPSIVLVKAGDRPWLTNSVNFGYVLLTVNTGK